MSLNVHIVNILKDTYKINLIPIGEIVWVKYPISISMESLVPKH